MASTERPHLPPNRAPGTSGGKAWLTVLAALVAVTALGLGACSSDDTDAATPTSTTDGATTTTAPAFVAEEFEGDDFYAVPDPIPDVAHGTLLRYQVMEDNQVEGSTTYRIMYTSESLEGDPIAVTGMASVPTAAAPEGGRPVITIAHGTTGIADECAPSKKATAGEMSLVRRLGGDTYLIAATDYEGLGTPGRHPYLVGESEGRSTLDAAIAAGSLPDAEPSDQLAIVGYSQGGHGALWANELATEWAPDLDVVGTFAGAPASEVGVILAAAPRLPQAGFAYMVIAGIAEAYPEADPATFLTEQGVELLDTVDEGCVRNIFAAVGGVPVDDLILPNGVGSEPWDELGPAQDPGQRKTNDAPVLIIHSEGDQTVPLFFSEALLARLCDVGVVAERREIDGGGHTGAAVPAYEQAMEWLGERFADDPATPVSSCDAA